MSKETLLDYIELNTPSWIDLSSFEEVPMTCSLSTHQFSTTQRDIIRRGLADKGKVDP